MLGWMLLTLGIGAAFALGRWASAVAGRRAPATGSTCCTPAPPYTRPMVMPPGHGSEAQRLRPLQRREKVLAGGVGGLMAIALAVVLIVSLTHADKRSGHGCIAVSLAYSMGGTQDYRCGAAARAMCSGVGRPGLTGAAGDDVARACRRAGLAVS